MPKGAGRDHDVECECYERPETEPLEKKNDSGTVAARLFCKREDELERQRQAFFGHIGRVLKNDGVRMRQGYSPGAQIFGWPSPAFSSARRAG